MLLRVSSRALKNTPDFTASELMKITEGVENEDFSLSSARRPYLA